MGVDISNDLDQLLGDSEPPGDSTGALAKLARLLPDRRPTTLILRAPDGELLATWRNDPNQSANPVAQLARDFARHSSRDAANAGEPWFHFDGTAKQATALAIRGNGDTKHSPATLLCLGDADCDRSDDPPANLTAIRAAIDLATVLTRTDQTLRACEIRNRHLQAEQDTLKRSYAQIMSNALEEREQRLREQREYMVHLEREVSRRSTDLRDALERANAANRTKSEFLANMSHEIRTPMTAILGYTDLLIEESWGRPRSLEWLYIVRRNGQHLLEIINDILDISKIEAGKLLIEKVTFSPAQILREVVELMRSRAAEKGLELVTDREENVPEVIESDPTRLKQILVNLVGNAIKFTQDGRVRIVLARAQPGMPPSDQPGGDLLRFDVVDTGIGMTPDQVGRLFSPFSQADSSTTRRFGGTGLGLAISKRLAQILGGDITVVSQLDVGSTFSLTIDVGSPDPANPIASQPSTPEDHPAPTPTGSGISLEGVAVLLAEDGPDNQRLIRMILERAGADVAIAENGRIACDRVEKAAAAKTPFDLVLMDMQMPEMDGYTATSRLRQRGHNLPIIALTAHAMSGDREKCLDAGCTDYAAKPIDVHKLLHLVARHITTARSDTNDESPNASADPNAAHDAASVARATGSLNHDPPTSPPGAQGPLFSSFAGDPDMAELIDMFVTDLPQRVRLIDEALGAGDLDTLGKLTHQLKGSAGGFGFEPITASAAEVERQLRTDAELTQVEAAVNDLLDLCRRAMNPTGARNPSD